METKDIPHAESPFTGSSQWVWAADSKGINSYSRAPIAYFRRVFRAPARGRIVVSVSADSRYALYLNGQELGRGPAKGDVAHQFYETFRAPASDGANLLAAVVVCFSGMYCAWQGAGAPGSVMAFLPSFVVDGGVWLGDECIAKLSTPDGWLALEDSAYTLRFGPESDAASFEEYLDLGRYPRGWSTTMEELPGWSPAKGRHVAYRPGGCRDPFIPYGLIPRMIPLLEQAPRRFANVAYSDMDKDEVLALIRDDRPMAIAPNRTVRLVLDAGELTTGILNLDWTGGQGASVAITASEAWYVAGKKTPAVNPAGGEVRGQTDRIEHIAGDHSYRPLEWRTFRPLQIIVSTADETLTIVRCSYLFTAYPFEERAWLKSSDGRQEDFWRRSWRTLRLCAHETFEDCPYYEQNQYWGDTQVMALCTGYVSGDWRLVKQALHHYDWSRGRDGLSMSRYPIRIPQYIPSWSLLGIVMARDYWWHTGDSETVRDVFPAVRSVLQWFSERTNEDGVLFDLPHWVLVDWVPGWPVGVPPGGYGGVSAIVNLQYAVTLRAAAELADLCGKADMATELRMRSDQVTWVIRRRCWRADWGVLADQPGGEEASELGNAWAVLADALSPEEARAVCAQFGVNPRLARSSLYGRFYLFRALSKAGCYNLASGLLDLWHRMAKTGLSTWPEEPSLGRSYCHGWSSTPIYEQLAEMLGIRPAAAGLSRVLIAPQPFHMEWLEGAVPTKAGEVRVRWERDASGSVRLFAHLPAETPALLRWPDGSEALVESNRVYSWHDHCSKNSNATKQTPTGGN